MALVKFNLNYYYFIIIIIIIIIIIDVWEARHRRVSLLSVNNFNILKFILTKNPQFVTEINSHVYNSVADKCRRLDITNLLDYRWD